MYDLEIFKIKLESVLKEVESIKQRIAVGNESVWTMSQIVEIVEPEIKELYEHAINGEVYFKYGRKQRMLVSSYCLTDSLCSLSSTNLGIKIRDLQEVYNRL